MNLTIDLMLTNPSGDKLGVLRTKIKNEDLLLMDIMLLHYFFS